MCTVCHQYPCSPRCPNAPLPREVFLCAKCGDGILEGDEYIECGRDRYHADCAEEMTAREIAEKLLGDRVRIAEKP